MKSRLSPIPVVPRFCLLKLFQMGYWTHSRGLKLPKRSKNVCGSLSRIIFRKSLLVSLLLHCGLLDEQAYLQTAITSIIHRPYVMENHTLILGCGDSVFLTDPITVQGCNTASYAAEQIYETLVTNKEAAWDEAVGQLIGTG
ncbi:hypothetical protein F3P21_11360 [Paenibacillus glucanolyticus]|nr:hypothetical protein [Paenibacillus glucanolyticus]MPY17460.1 hypothetical protein [Paenibacillus glucanolyticus]